jgi:ubiquinone/menaquinone biosynthesis C-methylase UbiE
VKTYYSGKYARSYNQSWKVFSEKTLAATRSTIDFTRLRDAAQNHPLRILDVACGTGLLLQSFASLFPDAELYGIDASQEMLDQACALLKDHPHAHFAVASLIGGKAAGLPYEAASFDLITSMNALHYFKDPVAILAGLAQLLTLPGQLVIEDYARRGFPFPWQMFEWLIKRVDPQHIQAYTMEEAQNLCQAAGLQVTLAKKFPIDLLWHGWAIQTRIQ